MSEGKAPGDSFRVKIGDVSGSQVAVGSDIQQMQSTQGLSDAEMAQLRGMFDELRAKVEKEAPPEAKEKALERVTELQEAVTAKKPDLTTMEYVKKWFGKNLPALAGSVVSLIIHPLVGKAVQVGGEVLAATFRKRFGVEESSPS